MVDFNSPFADEIFQHIDIAWQVENCRSDSSIDSRGVKEIETCSITHRFTINPTLPQLQQSFGMTQAEEMYDAILVDGSGVLDPRVKPGMVGEGYLNGQPVKCILRNLQQSGIKIVPEILGQSFKLIISYKFKNINTANST